MMEIVSSKNYVFAGQGANPNPIQDQNSQNVYPISNQIGSKTIPFGAAHNI